mgnify:CR=1 FL=1
MRSRRDAPLRGKLLDSPEVRRARVERRVGWAVTGVGVAVMVVLAQLTRVWGYWWLFAGLGALVAFLLGQLIDVAVFHRELD